MAIECHKTSVWPQVVFKDDRSVHQTLSVCMEDPAVHPKVLAVGTIFVMIRSWKWYGIVVQSSDMNDGWIKGVFTAVPS